MKFLSGLVLKADGRFTRCLPVSRLIPACSPTIAPSTAALSLRRPAITGTPCDSCGNQDTGITNPLQSEIQIPFSSASLAIGVDISRLPGEERPLVTYRDSSISKITEKLVPIPATARSQAWVCSRSHIGISGSNPDGDMNVCLLCLLFVVR